MQKWSSNTTQTEFSIRKTSKPAMSYWTHVKQRNKVNWKQATEIEYTCGHMAHWKGIINNDSRKPESYKDELTKMKRSHRKWVNLYFIFFLLHLGLAEEETTYKL